MYTSSQMCRSGRSARTPELSKMVCKGATSSLNRLQTHFMNAKGMLPKRRDDYIHE